MWTWVRVEKGWEPSAYAYPKKREEKIKVHSGLHPGDFKIDFIFARCGLNAHQPVREQGQAQVEANRPVVVVVVEEEGVGGWVGG
jgi:hypothetical protein